MNITEEGKSMRFLKTSPKEVCETIINECKSLVELEKASKNLEYSNEVRKMLEEKLNQGKNIF